MPRHLVILITITLLSFVGCTDGDRMRRDLALLQERNQSDSLLTDSVLAQRLADYFDRHGSQNERLEAHYLLARTWADLGQAPRALDAFHTAAEQADTTRLDSLGCHWLSRIYGQMGGLLLEHQLPNNAINAYKNAEHYADKAGERSVVIVAYNQQASCYYALNKPDSVAIVEEKTYKAFLSNHDTLLANTTLGPLAFITIQNGNYQEAEKMLNLYEYHSLLNDSTILMYEEWKLLYYYKGYFYQNVESLDSALYYYYKEIQVSSSLNNLGLAYKGLYETYTHLGKSDSIAKYSLLYAETIDSIHSQSNAAALLGMQHLYDYSHFQTLADRKTIEAGQANRRTLILALFVLFLGAVAALWHVRYRARMALMCQQMNARYANALILYNKVKAELQTLTEQSTEQRQQAEAELEQLREELTKAQRDKCSPDQWTEVGELLNSRLFLEFHQAAAQAKTMPVEKWQQLRELVNAKMPRFIDSLCNYNYAPDLQETQLILLLKLRFLPSEISVLLRMTSYAISKKRKKLLKKMFNIDGSPDEFDRLIMLLGADEIVDF